VLRRCAYWLQRLERGENVVVNLRPDEDVETEFVLSTGRGWSACWNESQATRTLSLVPNDPHADKESNHHDPQTRHRHELAEPSREPEEAKYLRSKLR
jgi:hypothetical protein